MTSTYTKYQVIWSHGHGATDRYATRNEWGALLPGARELGTFFEVGGQTSPGVQGNPYPKLKTPRILSSIFFGETQVHVQNQTKIKLNGIDSRKLGGRRPHSFQVVGESCLHCPPPRLPRPWLPTPEVTCR